MDNKIFIVKGTFREGKHNSKFEKEVTGHNEAFIREKTYSEFGSRHHISRGFVKIDTVEEKK